MALPYLIAEIIEIVRDYIPFPKKFDYLRALRKSKRIERSEGRAGMESFLCAALSKMDWYTLQIGVPHKNKFNYCGINALAKASGFRTEDDEALDSILIANGKLPKRRGIRRAYRIVKRLIEGGALIAKKIPGVFYTVYEFTKTFFLDWLKVPYKKLKQQQQWAKESQGIEEENKAEEILTNKKLTYGQKLLELSQLPENKTIPTPLLKDKYPQLKSSK